MKRQRPSVRKLREIIPFLGEGPGSQTVETPPEGGLGASRGRVQPGVWLGGCLGTAPKGTCAYSGPQVLEMSGPGSPLGLEGGSVSWQLPSPLCPQGHRLSTVEALPWVLSVTVPGAVC